MFSAHTVLTSAAKEIESALDEISFANEYLKNIKIDDEIGFDTSKIIPIIELPFSFVRNRLLLIQEKFASFPDNLPNLVIPITLTRSCASHSKIIFDNAHRLKGHLEALIPLGGPQPTTWANIELASADRQLILNLVNDIIHPILKSTDAILTHLPTLEIIVDPSRIHAVVSDVKFIEITAAAKDQVENMREITNAAASGLEVIRNNLAKIEQMLNLAEKSEALVKQIRENIATIEGDTISKKAAADVAISAAAELKQQVDQYAAEFSTFQKSLEYRISALNKGNDDLSKLSKKYTDQTNEVEGLIGRAKSMLSSATNAGLTHAQQQKYDEIGKQLSSAGFWVFIAYVALFASVAPVVKYVWEANTIEFSSAWTYMGNVLARAVLLVPGGIAASFTTNRYMRLFRLRHEYAYRASLAGAVEGFRIQAPEHAQDLTAVAFYQLGLNPAQTIDNRGKNPDWYKKLNEIVEKFSDRFGHPPKKDVS